MRNVSRFHASGLPRKLLRCWALAVTSWRSRTKQCSLTGQSNGVFIHTLHTCGASTIPLPTGSPRALCLCLYTCIATTHNVSCPNGKCSYVGAQPFIALKGVPLQPALSLPLCLFLSLSLSAYLCSSLSLFPSMSLSVSAPPPLSPSSSISEYRAFPL